MDTTTRTALVTGASGHVGSHLVPALLDGGWTVRVLARSPEKLSEHWRDRVEVLEGDATERADLDRAMADVDVAYYLLHSMGGSGDFRDRDRTMATGFAEAADAADVGRIVYLGALHPEGVDLSEHMASRVEVGEVFLDGPVPTAVLQAGVVLGQDSASFLMLRHLTERLPVAFGPKWLRNRIQPIAVRDAVHYLVRAADLPPEVDRPIDIAMPQSLTYLEMMRRYAAAVGLGPRLLGTVPVLTPGLAALWVGVITPVSSGIARPLVASLVQDSVKGEDDAARLLGDPDGGLLGFEEAVERATEGIDPHRWRRVSTGVCAAVVATAVAGSLLTDPGSRWYRRISTPRWQPPALAFPIVWTSLYAAVAVASAGTIADLGEEGEDAAARSFSRALGVNLVLNTGWSGVFFRAHAPRAATAWAAALTASSADLARRAAASGPGKAAALGAYTAWCGFATALSGAIARRNRRH